MERKDEDAITYNSEQACLTNTSKREKRGGEQVNLENVVESI